ncbi:MAG TPA: imidazolonepropionase [Actinomycetota bacterium]|nr:imidazolonepropionase [Actinomycetota bacterium]
MTDSGGSSAIRVATLATMAAGGPLRRGASLGEPEVVRDGVLALSDGVVTYAGPAVGFADASPGASVVDLGDVAVVPGFVDMHSHVPFFGWRADEHAARLAGRSYRDLHGEGGIGRTARMLAGASDDEVVAFCRPLLDEMLTAGTTALELKTGYGLSVDAELRLARLARRLAAEVPQTCTVTLLACHAVPPGVDRADWVRTACGELIPAAAADGLVDAVDIYVEDIAFSLDDLAAVAEAAAAAGLPLRCHADQLGWSGAAEAAVRLGARSADHLNHAGPAGIAALGGAPATVAGLLPASTFTLRARPAPARELIEAGAAVALATDCNPGTSPVLSMPEVVAMGCTLYGLAPLEALTAATINPAWVLGLHQRVGSLERGKQADFLVLDSPDLDMVPYRAGHNPVRETWIAGRRTNRN